jgi:hypothetical protein
MSRDFFDPTPEQQNVILIEATPMPGAERMLASCEYCNPEVAAIPFDHILDRATGSDSRLTDYVLETPAKCPNCRRDIINKLFIEPA